jgi:hypothetical protein
MNRGDVLVSVLGATMALMLASRGLRDTRFSLRAKAGMALVWVAIIAAAALIASRWHP